MSNSTTPGPRVTLLGLDFGSTTSSALVATARLDASSPVGRRALADPQPVYRPDPVFTPFAGERVDADRVAALIDGWLAESGLDPDSLFSGGAIVTGLAAQADNAESLRRLVRDRLGEAVVAVADDPCLESWLAFMASAAALSRAEPERPVLNLDIGGGTTNSALGVNGNVVSTGCHFIGARHFRFRAGTFELEATSRWGAALAADRRIKAEPGRTLTPSEVAQLVGYYIEALERLVAGSPPPDEAASLANLHEQVPLDFPPHCQPVITFSGGVGELIYRRQSGEPWPELTAFGDLGVLLAERVCQSPLLSRDLRTVVPEHGGRATLVGLSLYQTEISGSTLFLPDPARLPLHDLPVVGTLSLDADSAEIAAALALVAHSLRGACLQISSSHGRADDSRSPARAVLTAPRRQAERVKSFARRLSAAWAAAPIPGELPLVLLVAENSAHALGNYATGWGREPFNLTVIDEVPMRDAQFVSIGRPAAGVVPVRYHGLSRSPL